MWKCTLYILQLHTCYWGLYKKNSGTPSWKQMNKILQNKLICISRKRKQFDNKPFVCFLIVLLAFLPMVLVLIYQNTEVHLEIEAWWFHGLDWLGNKNGHGKQDFHYSVAHVAIWIYANVLTPIMVFVLCTHRNVHYRQATWSLGNKIIKMPLEVTLVPMQSIAISCTHDDQDVLVVGLNKLRLFIATSSFLLLNACLEFLSLGK